MNESLAALRDPGLDTADLLCQLVCDIRRLVMHPDMSLADRLSGITGAVDELAPPPPPCPDDWQDASWDGRTPGGAAAMIAAQLRWRHGPATGLVEALSGMPARIEVTGEQDDGVTYVRAGMMTVGGIPAAETGLVLVTARIPPEAMAAIRAGRPAGTVLGPYGMTRRSRVRLDYGSVPVSCTASLRLGGMAVGRSAERFTRRFCALIAAS